MSDAELAAVSGLIGIGLSGGFQVGLAAWKDWKDRRAALRPIEAELARALATLTITNVPPRDLARFGSFKATPEWDRHQDRLARELPRRKWRLLKGGYDAYAVLRNSAEMLRDHGDDDPERYIKLVDVSAEQAERFLLTAHRSVAGWRVHRESKKAWKELREA